MQDHELTRLLEECFEEIESRAGRRLTHAEREEIMRPSGLSADELREAIGWAYHEGGQDAVEALIGGGPLASAQVPHATQRCRAEGRRINRTITRIVRKRDARVVAPRRVNGPSGRPRASATRSSKRSGDSPSDDDGDSEPDAAPPAAREAVAVVWEQILRRRAPSVSWEVVR